MDERKNIKNISVSLKFEPEKGEFKKVLRRLIKTMPNTENIEFKISDSAEDETIRITGIGKEYGTYVGAYIYNWLFDWRGNAEVKRKRRNGWEKTT